MKFQALTFLAIRAMIVLALIFISGWQVVDQIEKFFNKKTTIALRLVSRNQSQQRITLVCFMVMDTFIQTKTSQNNKLVQIAKNIPTLPNLPTLQSFK